MATLYVVVYSSALGAPSAAQIKAGQDVNGSAATWAAGSGSGVAWTGTGQQVTASGLTAGTSYKSSAVVSDGVTDSNVVTSAAFTTAVAITAASSASTASTLTGSASAASAVTAAAGASTASTIAASSSAASAITAAAGTSTAGTLTGVADTPYIRPTSDVTTTGWTATPGPGFYTAIDEASLDDADYITSPSLGTGDPIILGLGATLTAGNYTLRVRGDRTGSSGQIRVSLLDDTNTQQGVSAWQALTASWATYELSVTTTGSATRARFEVQA